MYKDTTYTEKCAILKKWLPQILYEIRKDLRNDHWKQDPYFVKGYLGNKAANKITNEEMAEGYTRALENEEGAESIAEFIATRWLLKHSDIYYFFEKELEKLTPEFTELTEIDAAVAESLVTRSVELFGAIETYLFSVFNSVVFSESTYTSLAKQAITQQGQQKEKEEEEKKLRNLEEVTRHYEQQISRLTDRFEKKLAGVERKYIQDTNTLKNQVRALQKKLEEARV